MSIECKFEGMQEQDGYKYFKLSSKDGRIGLFTDDFLIENMKNGNLIVSNLRISNGKIIQKTDKDISIENNIKVFNKYRNFRNVTSNLVYYEHEVMIGKKIYFLQITQDSMLLYIPDDIVNEVAWGDTYFDLMSNTIDKGDEEIEGIISAYISMTQVKRLKIIGGRNLIDCSEMFMSCQLNLLDLTDFDTSNVNNMSYMFKNAQINKILFGDFDTSKVVSMIEMFNDFNGVDLDLSSFDTSNVSFMGEMFCNCQIEHLFNIVNFDTSHVTNMEGMFEDCFVVGDVDFSNFDTSNVVSMQRMFAGSKIRVLNLLSFDTSKVIDMRRMFSGCEVSVLNVNSFNTMNTRYFYGMFMNCDIQLLDLDNFNFSSAEELHSMFMNSYITTLKIKGKGIDNSEKVLTDVFRDSMIVELLTESNKLKDIL